MSTYLQWETLLYTPAERRCDSPGSLQDHGNQHLVFCLLDGDGAIFEPCYIKRREKGGQDAAVSSFDYTPFWCTV